MPQTKSKNSRSTTKTKSQKLKQAKGAKPKAASKPKATNNSAKKSVADKSLSDFVNKAAPDFTLNDENGKKRTMKEFKGSYVLLYFYPKDMTPGCTIEAQNFRDQNAALKKLGVQVLGVSCDDEKSHQKFVCKQNLNFPLLADTKQELVKKYKVWVEKNMYGKKYMGIQRDSFLIDPKGVIIRHYVKVNPQEHASQVIADMKQFKN